jgi:hypothetical protein
MSVGAVVSMVLSLSFVIGLTLFCYLRVLRAPAKEKEELEHFHSA